ncbi:MAG: transketolase C-terminal domain-containing protein [Steroidobacteraceae bacterium]
MVANVKSATEPARSSAVDWRRVLRTTLLSRALDQLEESRLVPERKVLYQFSARGHDVTQALLGLQLTGSRDAVAPYYRSRPLALALGLSPEEALASTMMRAEGMSAGRDIGVVLNMPNAGGPCLLPACGGVGTQYTPATGWAQALVYRQRVLGDGDCAGSIAVAHGGDASIATNGFWASLNIATTERLPLLYFIEDNGYGISVPATRQTPGGDFAANLAAFRNLGIVQADGSEIAAAAAAIGSAVAAVRSGEGPVLLRLLVPRLSGHSGQDTQAYKSAGEIASEQARDPLLQLRKLCVPATLTDAEWQALEQEAEQAVSETLARIESRPRSQPAAVMRFAFSERRADGSIELQRQGGQLADGAPAAAGSLKANPDGPRINMLTAIRRTLEHELAVNPRVLVFGEDVGRKGGVHAATLGLQARFGEDRVFDTSLSEEGIIGRAVGMALAGLVPVPEIQFRKYAEPAAEQLHDCGTMRWRTANRFAAPMVVRMPGGFFKCGDPWHSQCNEAQFLHAVGWRVAMPSNAEDAVGLLRTALRGNDPVIFFEHRSLLDGAGARRPWPGDEYVLPFGVARCVHAGTELTVVSWGAMVERCEQAAAESGVDVELLDLRALSPWDREAVLASVAKTRRCLVVHEDNLTAGFGAEIAAVLAQHAFFDLDAPIERLAMPDVPSPHSPELLDQVVPSVAGIVAAMRRIASA